MSGIAISLSLAGLAQPAMFWAALGVFGLGVLYLLAVAAAHRAEIRRELDRAFGAPGGDFDWAGLSTAGELDRLDAPAATPLAAANGDPRSVRSLARFMAGYALGWGLMPLAIAVRLLAGDRRDLQGDGALARLVAAQKAGRELSLRALLLSLATASGFGVTGAALAGAPAASAAPVTTTYTVAPGDTLGSIAAAHATTVSALAAANGISDPNLIYVGQRLVLAAGSSVAGPVASPARTYTVVAGDTLSAIAARFGTTVAALAAANHLSDPNLVVVGQVLEITSVAGGGTAPAAGAPAARPSTYTVAAGDTLGAIAARFGTTVTALAAANHIADPNMIFAGEILYLDGPAPAAGATTPSAPSTPSTPTPAASTLGARALSVALAQQGKPYQWGGAGPSSFDCSGLVMYAYRAVGVSLPHYTVTQYEDTARVSEAQLEQGDLVFYGGSAPSHVAMYAGGGRIVTADTTGTPVRVEPITWDGVPSGFGRVG